MDWKLGLHARKRHDTVARVRTGSPRRRQRYAREVLTAGGWMGGSGPAPIGMARSSRSSDPARTLLAGLPPRKAAQVQNCSRLCSILAETKTHSARTHDADLYRARWKLAHGSAASVIPHTGEIVSAPTPVKSGLRMLNRFQKDKTPTGTKP